MLYAVFLHNTINLKYFFTVLSMISLHDAHLATNQLAVQPINQPNKQWTN